MSKRGRPKGSKNLVKTEDGFLMNEHGVKFTPEEVAEFRRLQKNINAKRAYQLKKYGELPRSESGEPTGETVGQSIQKMGKEPDFIIAKRQQKINDFRNKNHFDDKMDSYKKVADRGYLNLRAELYRNNYINTLEKWTGVESSDIVEKIKNMSPKQFMQAVASDEALTVDFLYPEATLIYRLNEIRRALSMSEQDVDINAEFYDVEE